MFQKKCLFSLVLLCYLFSCIWLSNALDNGLALRPPMGWMSWQRYRCNTDCVNYPNDCLNDALIRRIADAMVEKGYAKSGYQYIVIDDCWFARERDPVTHKLVADKERFPYGIKSLSDYIHSKGLRFGIYLDIGTHTCAGYPGSRGYYELDAQTLAEWEVDYTKVDGCYSDASKVVDHYEELGKALNATGRPIVYSCSYPAYINWVDQPDLVNWKKLSKNCNLWRMMDDIDDSWASVSAIINQYANFSELLQKTAHPGSWNDPDMLVLGNYGLSPTQSRAQMSMWAMFAAPLLMSADLDQVDHYSRDILQHKRLIEINQDSAGKQAICVKTIGKNIKVWIRLLADGDATSVIAVTYLGAGGGPIHLKLSLQEVFLLPQHKYSLYNWRYEPNVHGLESITEREQKTRFTLRNVYNGKVEYSNLTGNSIFLISVPPSGASIFDVIRNS